MSKTTETYTDLEKLRHSCAHVLAQAVKRRYLVNEAHKVKA